MARHNHARFAGLVALAITFALGGLCAAQAAQDQTLARQGKLLAQSMCADCHTFGGETRNDRPAPDFAAVGAMPSATQLSLRVFLKSTHATMPNLILDDGQIDALSAYILDLGGK